MAARSRRRRAWSPAAVSAVKVPPTCCRAPPRPLAGEAQRRAVRAEQGRRREHAAAGRCSRPSAPPSCSTSAEGSPTPPASALADVLERQKLGYDFTYFEVDFEADSSLSRRRRRCAAVEVPSASTPPPPRRHRARHRAGCEGRYSPPRAAPRGARGDDGAPPGRLRPQPPGDAVDRRGLCALAHHDASSPRRTSSRPSAPSTTTPSRRSRCSASSAAPRRPRERAAGDRRERRRREGEGDPAGSCGAAGRRGESRRLPPPPRERTTPELETARPSSTTAISMC